MENFDQYYRCYKYMQKNLASDFTANYLRANMEDNDKGEDVLSGKLHEKVIDMDWVVEIEETLPYIDKAIAEQRRMIIENSEVLRVEQAKVINKHSVKHLIQHTNFIDHIDEQGRVTPNKILTIEREDSFETYENRFLITMIEQTLNFVSEKYSKMVDTPTDTYNHLQMERDMVLNNQHVTFKLDYSNEAKESGETLLDIKDYEKLSDFDRVRRIRQKLNAFLVIDMMVELKSCNRVKAPINRTNLMIKNPNFKACLDLFTFITNYNKPGFEIVGREFMGEMDKEVQEAVYISQGYQHFMISIATNPALRKLLEQRYQEDRAGRGKAGDSEIEAMIENVRKEEMKIRLEEIREREKIIRDQKTELAALKRNYEKHIQMIENLKGTIKVLEAQIKELRNELEKVKAEHLKALERIAELEARVTELEAMVAALTAKVAQLESAKAQLEAKITELEGVIAEQKTKIAEQERTIVSQRDRINELERYVSELENTKAALQARVTSLEEETAQQKQKIQEQNELIASQVATIDTLDKEIKSAKEQIANLTAFLEQRETTIAAQTATIAALTNDVVQLRSDLTNEKQLHQEDIEAQKAENAAEIEKLNKKFADDKAALIAAQEAELEKLNADHDAAVEKLNKEHDAELEKLGKQKAEELAQLQKDADNRLKAAQKDADNRLKAAQKEADNRVKAAQKEADSRAKAARKDAEKKAKEQIKTEVSKAQDQVKQAEKKANDAVALYRRELKIDRGVDGLFKYDFTFGALGEQALKAEIISTAGGDMSTLPGNRNLQCLYIVKDSKKVTLYGGEQRKLKVIKNFRGTTDINACRELVKENMKNADKSCAYVTYKTVDKNEVSNFAKFLKSDADIRVTRTFHNKTQRSGKSSIGIYFYKNS